MSSDSIAKQIAFIVEADRLKTVIRRTPLTNNSRLENSAEHSWHLAVAAIALREHAPASIDLSRVLEMVAVHDLVEIDAGDTFAYDSAAHHDKAERERTAAQRIYGLLPSEQGNRLRTLWEEFESAETADARYANALDRFQALLQNMESGGGSWAAHGVTRAQVLVRMAPIKATLPQIWPFVLEVIDRFCASGAIVSSD